MRRRIIVCIMTKHWSKIRFKFAAQTDKQLIFGDRVESAAEIKCFFNFTY